MGGLTSWAEDPSELREVLSLKSEKGRSHGTGFCDTQIIMIAFGKCLLISINDRCYSCGQYH